MNIFRRLFSSKGCDEPRATVDPAIQEKFREVRETTHAITAQAFQTHALVRREEKSVQLAEDALRLSRGERR
jgi:hypothetical protein